MDKNGVIVSEAKGLPDIVESKGCADFCFQATSTGEVAVKLEEVTVVGPQRRAFAINYKPSMLDCEQVAVQVTFTSTGIGLYRGAIRMRFRMGTSDFVIVRHVTVKSGDKTIDDMLKPS